MRENHLPSNMDLKYVKIKFQLNWTLFSKPREILICLSAYNTYSTSNIAFNVGRNLSYHDLDLQFRLSAACVSVCINRSFWLWENRHLARDILFRRHVEVNAIPH